MEKIKKNNRNDRRQNEYEKSLSLNIGIRTVLLNCWKRPLSVAWRSAELDKNDQK
jgi:hypothetical protein